MAERTAGRRTGRRPGPSTARRQIVDTARRLFVAQGFDGTSMRAIARQAGVDPALVLHYFDSKETLFAAALRPPIDLEAALRELLKGDRATIARRLLRTILDVWGKDREADLLVGIARSAVTNERAAAQLRRIAGPELLGGLTRALGLDEPELRASIVVSQVMGLIMARYLIRVPLLAEADPARLVRLYAPAIQRTLTDPLDPTG